MLLLLLLLLLLMQLLLHYFLERCFASECCAADVIHKSDRMCMSNISVGLEIGYT